MKGLTRFLRQAPSSRGQLRNRTYCSVAWSVLEMGNYVLARVVSGENGCAGAATGVSPGGGGAGSRDRWPWAHCVGQGGMPTSCRTATVLALFLVLSIACPRYSSAGGGRLGPERIVGSDTYRSE